MSGEDTTYLGRRISYDGALCTVRCKGVTIPGTKGTWLGVEWDNPERGKHNGTHAGKTYFACWSIQPKIASFVRPNRKPDLERTVLEAINFKYVSKGSQTEAVVISGKVAEEIGFDKISREQSVLADLRLVVLDNLCINGIAPRRSSRATIEKAQAELAETCPNIVELDLGHNPIETWTQVEDICTALPKLRILRLNCLRLRDFKSSSQFNPPSCMAKIEELHLNECLLRPFEILQILQGSGAPRLRSLQSLWLSQNELPSFDIVQSVRAPTFDTIKTLMLENNLFESLDSIPSILSTFPEVSDISLQSNKISNFGKAMTESAIVSSYTNLKTLNLSQNSITSWSFVDLLPRVFPKLSSFRISRNPLYDGPTSGSTPTANSTDTSYYLTLARIPTLQNLNHARITPQEREEGEMYFLSVTEKDIRATLTTVEPKDTAAATKAISMLQVKYSRYSPLCQKHDHDDLIAQFQALTSNTAITTTTTAGTGGTPSSTLLQPTLPSTPSAPPGSLLSRLITTTFYIPPNPSNPPNLLDNPPLSSFSSSSPSLINHTTTSPSPSPSTSTFTRAIPATIPTSSVFALVARTMALPSLSFRLVYESEELDPSREDTTTRSQLYAKRRHRGRGKEDKENDNGGKGRWDDWGDWDADAMVERAAARVRGRAEMGMGVEGGEGGRMEVEMETEGKWTEDGVLIKNGKKWRKREVQMLFGMRGWGEWLEKGVKVCRVRVEPFERGREKKEM